MKRWIARCLIALMLGTPLLAPLPAQATVNSSVNKTTVLGNGAQTQFAFSFVGVASAYISVIFTDASGNQTALAQGSGATQYQITLNPPLQGAIWGIGGTVTYNPGGSPIANGTTLTIFRTLPLTQAVSLQNKTSLTALGNGAETGLDLGVMLDQQNSDRLVRAITAPIVDPPTINLVLPTAAQRANTGIAFDSQGNVIAGVIPATGIISSAMQPVVNAGSLAAGRAAFGLGGAATLSPNCQLLSNASAPGNLDVGSVLTQVAVNQAVTASFCGQTYIATGPINFTLPRANTLWNGFGLWIHVLGSGGAVTLVIDSHDTIEGLTSGVSGTLLLNSWAFITTDAAASGNWRISFTSNYPNTPTSSGGSVDLFFNAMAQVDQTWEGNTAFCDGSNNPHTIAAGGPTNPSRVTETYGPDGWRIGCDTGTGIFTGRQVTSASIGNPVPGVTNYMQFVVTTADASATATNNYHLEIPVEGPRVAQLKYGTSSAVSLACQLQFGSTVNGTYSFSAVEGNANSLSQVATFAYAGGGAVLPISFTYAPFTTGTWNLTPGQFSFKWILDLGSGSNFETTSTFTPVAGLKLRTPGSAKFIATNGAVMYVSAIQCDPGTALLPFRFKSYGQDFADAEYFYKKTFLRGTAVAQNAGIAGAIGYNVHVAGTATDSVLATWPKMPNVPSLYSFNPGNTNAKWRNNNTLADSGTPAFNAVGMSSSLVSDPQVGGDGVSHFMFLHLVANGRLGGF